MPEKIISLLIFWKGYLVEAYAHCDNTHGLSVASLLSIDSFVKDVFAKPRMSVREFCKEK